MNLREEPINKPLSNACFHYHDDTRQFSYVGAVWQDEPNGEWKGFCTCDGLYGHLGEFDSRESALDCLKRRVGGDKSAKGRNAD